MSSYDLILAEDHVLVRQGLCKVLQGFDDVTIVGEADDGLQLLDLLRKRAPDLVIVDISMPRLRGIEAIREALVIRPGLAFIVLSMHRDIELVRASMSAGARGYVLKEDAATELFAALRKVRAGGIYVSPKILDAVTDDWVRRPDGEPHHGGDALSTREREILKLTAEGMSCKEMAGALVISHRTVEHHRANIMAKLQLRNAADMVRYALDRGYI